MYDIIGDVHGYAQLLKKMLLKLGYSKTPDGYSHSSRKAVFIGDFINRGPEIRKTIKIIRKMVENGNGLAILGNHELNALIVESKNKGGSAIVNPIRKSYLSVFKTLNEFSSRQEEWDSHMRWMRTLPLFIEKDSVRFVHACWSDESIKFLKNTLPPEKLKRRIIKGLYKYPDSEISRNIGLVTRGVYFNLPGNLRLKNNKGISPRSFRTQWWENPDGKTFEEISFESKYVLPSYSIPEQLLPNYYQYDEKEPIVFFGHYCRGNGPFIIRPNICCVDSCVAGTKTLTAYCWEGEERLDEKHLVMIR